MYKHVPIVGGVYQTRRVTYNIYVYDYSRHAYASIKPAPIIYTGLRQVNQFESQECEYTLLLGSRLFSSAGIFDTTQEAYDNFNQHYKLLCDA